MFYSHRSESSKHRYVILMQKGPKLDPMQYTNVKSPSRIRSHPSNCSVTLLISFSLPFRDHMSYTVSKSLSPFLSLSRLTYHNLAHVRWCPVPRIGQNHIATSSYRLSCGHGIFNLSFSHCTCEIIKHLLWASHLN